MQPHHILGPETNRHTCKVTNTPYKILLDWHFINIDSVVHYHVVIPVYTWKYRDEWVSGLEWWEGLPGGLDGDVKRGFLQDRPWYLVWTLQGKELFRGRGEVLEGYLQ